MHIVVMGCGRVGSGLARRLDELGHDVSIIDQQAVAFRRLGPEFGGRQVTGVGFDRTTLIEAGVETADAFAAVSSGDNSNIIAARVARETFGIDHVVARIYDPKRAAVYERLGIPTVATVLWTIDRLTRALLPGGVAEDWRPVAEMEPAVGVRVAFLTRFGEGMIPTASTVLQDGDLVHALVQTPQVDDVARRASADRAEER